MPSLRSRPQRELLGKPASAVRVESALLLWDSRCIRSGRDRGHKEGRVRTEPGRRLPRNPPRPAPWHRRPAARPVRASVCCVSPQSVYSVTAARADRRWDARPDLTPEVKLMASVLEALSFPFRNIPEPALLVRRNSRGNLLSGSCQSPQGVGQLLSSDVTML